MFLNCWGFYYAYNAYTTYSSEIMCMSLQTHAYFHIYKEKKSRAVDELSVWCLMKYKEFII